MVVAISTLLMNTYPGATANPNNNPACGKSIQATYMGKSVTVSVVDTCMGCAIGDLDFSPRAFNLMADPSVGRLRGVTVSCPVIFIAPFPLDQLLIRMSIDCTVAMVELSKSSLVEILSLFFLIVFRK